MVRSGCVPFVLGFNEMAKRHLKTDMTNGNDYTDQLI